jgi:hypothetical protein
MRGDASKLLIIGLGAAGLGYTVSQLGSEITALENQHWVMLFIVLVVGYVMGRLWTAPAQMLGLP